METLSCVSVVPTAERSPQVLVGGFNPLKNMKVRWDHYSQYMEKNVPNHQPELLSVHRLEEASPTGEAQETAHDDEGLDDETNALDL